MSWRNAKIAMKLSQKCSATIWSAETENAGYFTIIKIFRLFRCQQFYMI